MNNSPKICGYSGCKKPLTETSVSGRVIPEHRLEKKQYCDNACARRAASEKKHKQRIRAQKSQELIDDWIYGRLQCQNHLSKS